MSSIYPPEAKAILFLLTNQIELAQKVIAHFEPILGPLEIQSDWRPFNQSDYYEKELGKNLKRCLVSFKNIFEPHRLAELKQRTTKLEYPSPYPLPQGERERERGRRTINVDPGYVDLFKVVLASGKAGGQKVALSKEVHAYTLLRYEKGKWIPFEWTYPDFKESTYHKELLEIRKILKKELAGHFE